MGPRNSHRIESATGAATLATITVDFNVLRRPAMLLHGLQGLDQAYTFYYDETNDHRLIRIRDDGLNVKPPQCFVLGGILHAGAPRALKVAAVFGLGAVFALAGPCLPEITVAFAPVATVADRAKTAK